MKIDINIFYGLVLETNIEKNVSKRHTRKQVVDFLKQYKLNISASKLITMYRDRCNEEINGYNTLCSIITELQRDSSINKILK